MAQKLLFHARHLNISFLGSGNMKITKIGLGVLCLLGAMSAQSAVYIAGDSTFQTFDASNNAGSEQALLPAVTLGNSAERVTDVNIGIEFAKCDDPTLTSGSTCPSAGEEYSSEMFFYLLSPLGTRVDLVWTYSLSADGMTQGSLLPGGTYPNASNVGGRHLVGFDDQAGAGGVGPVMTDGIFRPEELLSVFNGQDPTGTWLLGMGDSVGADPLSYFRACLSVATQGSLNGFGNCGIGIGTVPEPGSLPLALLGLGALAAGVLRRRT